MMLKIIDGGRCDEPKVRRIRPMRLLRRRIRIGQIGADRIAIVRASK